MDFAQDDSPVSPVVEKQWQAQYWSDGYVPNETVLVKSLLDAANSERDRYLEGNDTLQQTIQYRNDEINQLKQELTDITMQKPLLEAKLLGPTQLFSQDQEMVDTSDMVEAVVTYGLTLSNWVRHTLNAFRAFIPV